MNKKERNILILVFIVILLMAFYEDMTNGVMQKDGSIERSKFGGESKELDLYVEAEGVLPNTKYVVEIVPELPTEDMAKTYFKMAVEQIEMEFKVEDSKVSIQDSYLDNVVTAEWRFEPYGYIDSNGKLILEEIPEEGMLIQAEVFLSCGEYEQIYAFPFWVKAPVYSGEELLLKGIQNWIEVENQKEGKNFLELPETINGVSLKWTEKKEYLVVKIFVLEIAAIGLLIFAQRRKQKEEEEKRKRELELSYPEVVNQLAMLLQAGMTMRQAWNRIAIQYEEKKKRGKTETMEAFEAILHLNRRLRDGEKERVNYELFTKEVHVTCYRRLMRALIANLEKGNRDLSTYLELESQKAYEERILLAKKLGEEASTKMLIPLMIMLVLVMFVVMAPAFIGLSL